MRFKLHFLFMLSLFLTSCSDYSSDFEKDVYNITTENFLISEEIIDFGQIGPSEFIQPSFFVYNKAKNPISIELLELSCTCVDIQFDENLIQPKERVEITIPHQTPVISKAETLSAKIRFFNDTISEEHTFIIKYEVITKYDITPSELKIVSKLNNQDVTSKILVKIRNINESEITAINSDIEIGTLSIT